MTTLPHGRAIPQPQLKASSTVQSSRLEAIADHSISKPASRARSKSRPARIRHDTATSDFASSSATLSLIRRILAPDKSTTVNPRSSPRPVQDILPPLTSSNDIDVQLYAIIAVIIKDFVNIWYSKITPDHAFTDEIIQIFAHCTRALEQRIRDVAIVNILLDEVPDVLERHIATYRIATSSSKRQSYGCNAGQIYHTLNSHPALKLPLHRETTYHKLLVTGALAVLLPTEDLQNAPLRILVGDIIADIIVGQVLSEKVCEGWFVHQTITRVIAIGKERIEPKASGEQMREDTKSRLERFGLLSSEADKSSRQPSARSQSALSTWFWQIMQGCYFAYLLLCFLWRGIYQARSSAGPSKLPCAETKPPEISEIGQKLRHSDQPCRPILSCRIFGTISTLIRLNERMPWFASLFMFWQHLLVFSSVPLASAGSIVDRFLHTTIQMYLLPPSIIPSILLSFRVGVFPNNSLGPAVPPPVSPEECLAIRRQAAESILSIIPPIVARTYYNSNDEETLQQIEEDILDVFGDKYMNKHLIYGILELILVRLIPELGEKSVGQLLAERGVLLESEDVDS